LKTLGENEQIGKPICDWEDHIMGLRKICCEEFSWIKVAQDRIQCLCFVNMVMKFWGLMKVGNLLTGWTSTVLGGFCTMELVRKLTSVVPKLITLRCTELAIIFTLSQFRINEW